MVFGVDFLGKMIYLCNILLFEKLLFWNFGVNLRSWIFNAFILACFIKDLGEKLLKGIFYHLKILEWAGYPKSS